MRHRFIACVFASFALVGLMWSVDFEVVKPQSVSAQSALCPGDFNGDGKVNLADFLAFAGGFGARSGDANYNSGLDLDGSGAVDLSDFLAFAGVFGTKCPVPPSRPVSIPDENLRAVIEDSLGKARGAKITRAEMATLTRLEAPNSGIRDLTGLEFSTGLTVLRLGPESVSTLVNSTDKSDLSPLAETARVGRRGPQNAKSVQGTPEPEVTERSNRQVCDPACRV